MAIEEIVRDRKCNFYHGDAAALPNREQLSFRLPLGRNNISASPITQTTLHKGRGPTDDARRFLGCRVSGRLGMFIRLMAAAAGAGAIFIAAGALANDSGALEEIVVTAQRRVESAQNVGIAMSVLSGSKLRRKVHQLCQRSAKCGPQPAGRAGVRQQPAAVSSARRGVHRLHLEQHLAGGRQPRRRRVRPADPNAGPAVRHRSR